MIRSISLHNITSFKQKVQLQCDKEVILVYGLNGSGKTTTSSFLYKPDDPVYSSCSIEKTCDMNILTYNQRFVEDSFYEDGNLKGVFTLSKENKAIKEKLSRIDSEISNLGTKLNSANEEITSSQSDIKQEEEDIRERLWSIKTTYAGGDRVLEFCLSGLQRKEKIYQHLLTIGLDGMSQLPDISKLKERASALNDDSSILLTEYSEVKQFHLSDEKIEVLKNQITGGSDGPIAKFIKELENSDWVSKGLTFIDTIEGPPHKCPFCQESTLSEALLASIRSVFDETFESNKAVIAQIATDLELFISSSKPIQNFTEKVWSKEQKEQYLSIHQEWVANLRENLLRVQSKIGSMANSISLSLSDKSVNKMNEIIKSVNENVKLHNFDVSHKDKAKKEIKSKFWSCMKSQYSEVIESHSKRMIQLKKRSSEKEEKLKSIQEQLDILVSQAAILRKQTVNIDVAVESINNRLADLGVSGFSIQKHNTDGMYCLARPNMESGVFKSLSEGEKTIISFLYFIERCHGALDPKQMVKPKAAVIDDPISSLSHQYVFNVGQYIKKEFVNNPAYEQVIVLTHSLYFFYELTFTKKSERDSRQKLYRLIKNEDGSSFLPMKYEEIQNDYQTYWAIVKDPNNNPALIANCMRNIIEHFFAFVRKRDFNNVFQMKELADDKYTSFNRYMNRESHSLGQNIFDIKEFDYQSFSDGLKAVFEATGYLEHYKAMQK